MILKALAALTGVTAIAKKTANAAKKANLVFIIISFKLIIKPFCKKRNYF